MRRARSGRRRALARGQGFQGLAADTPAAERSTRRAVCDAYLAAYLDRPGVGRDTVARCEPAMAAALLRAEPDNPERDALARIAG